MKVAELSELYRQNEKIGNKKHQKTSHLSQNENKKGGGGNRGGGGGAHESNKKPKNKRLQPQNFMQLA